MENLLIVPDFGTVPRGWLPGRYRVRSLGYAPHAAMPDGDPTCDVSDHGGFEPSALLEDELCEVLLKFLRHNIVVLVQSVYELGIEPAFWGEVAHD